MRAIELLSVITVAGAGAWWWTGGPQWSPEEAAFDGSFPESPAQEAARRVDACRKILIRDATAPARWCDLAEALEAQDQRRQAAYCFERALHYGPNQPPILLRAAEFDLRAGRIDQALVKFGRILTIVEEGEYDPVVFELLDGLPLRVEALLGSAVPASARPVRSFLRHQIRSGKLSQAEFAWRWACERRLIDDALAGEYAEFLIRQGRAEQAARSWADYLGPRRGDYRRTNYLFNESFEAPATGSPFDWRITPAPGAEIGLEAGEAYAGLQALKVRFLGEENLDFHHVAQKAVTPAGRWRLEAWVRTEEVTTNEGVRLRVWDVEAPGRLDAVTGAVSGSTPWRKLATEFRIQDGARLVEVQLVRRPSWKLDNKIRGTVWVDAVRLERLG